MMDNPQGALQNLTMRAYGRMLRLYPPRFRREFAGEVHAVFQERLAEQDRPGFALQELAALSWSILRERWHERRTRKGEGMEVEPDGVMGASGAAVLRSAGVPQRGFWWLLGWILSALLVLPLAIFTTYAFSLPFMAALNLGTRLNWWPALDSTSWLMLGFNTGLGIFAAWVQWLLLRRYLPGAGRWFAATALGLGLGGILAAVFRVADVLAMEARFARYALVFLAIGLVLGLLQWLFLRRSLHHAFWLVPVNLLAAASLLPIRMPIDWTLSLVLLPGIISGVGIWILLRQESAVHPQIAHAQPTRQAIPWPRRLVRVGLPLAIVAAVFFAGVWINASAMLLDAKASGAYPTLEEAITQHASQGWEEQGAKILSLSVESVSPAVVNGVRQHVRWGCATIQLDRIPARHRHSAFPICTQYIHTREGWVMMGEGLSPFVGWAMELYNLEGLREFRTGN
jgi:hypothetical protein